MDVLSIKDLKVYYYTLEGAVKAVNGVDLNLPRGKTVGLVGESGCGKSTVALAIMRLVPRPGKIVGGTILLKEQKNLLGVKEDEMRRMRGKDISMIFQNPTTYLNPVMKVGDQVAEIITIHQGLSKREAREKVLGMMKRVRIPYAEQVYESYPHQLSGGMVQRIVIVTALSCNPSLLIADEPTTALDVTIQAQVLNLLKQLKRDFDVSLLLITHDLGIVADIADIVYVMYAGKILERADVVSLYEKPRHPYTQGLISSALSIDEFKKDLVAIQGTVPNLLDPPSGCPFHPRCSRATTICEKKEPPTMEIEKDHAVSCWLFD